MLKDIIIINSRLTTYKFDDNRELTLNKITFAYRDDNCSDKMSGYDTILTCNLNTDTYEITRKIRPNEIVKAKLSYKKDKDNKFKCVISSINNVEV